MRAISPLKGNSKVVKNAYICSRIEETMAQHNEFGRTGEDYAADYLRGNGYFIRDRNWRTGHKELDIVAEKDNELIIVEVKTRRTTLYGHPVDAVSSLKIRKTVLAAEAYVRYFKLDMKIRFDVVTVVGSEPNMKIEHIEDAFRSPVWYK